MFYDGGYLVGGMHWFWWIFWVMLVGVIVFYGWGRPNGPRRRSRQRRRDLSAAPGTP